jgi:hypothetical protein
MFMQGKTSPPIDESQSPSYNQQRDTFLKFDVQKGQIVRHFTQIPFFFCFFAWRFEPTQSSAISSPRKPKTLRFLLTRLG